jgi:transposase
MSTDSTVVCSCCGKTRQRHQVHALEGGVGFVCRRCGLWIALRPHNDKGRDRKE